MSESIEGSTRGDPISQARLDDAVARGVISAEQLAAIRALPEPEAPTGSVEARSGLNAVMIAYHLGAAAVVFAFGWFIVDRWEALGPAGVLAVALVYAAIFHFSARYLNRLGFGAASSLLTLLTVAMTPIATWALLNLAGWWYEPPFRQAYPYIVRVDLLEALRWIPLELATALAALVALRRVHYGILALPVVIAIPYVASQLLPLFVEPDLAPELWGWLAIVSGVVVIAIGYWVEQHPRDGADYAFWIYLVGLGALGMGVVASWRDAGVLRHALPLLAVLLFAASLFLRRPLFLIFGAAEFLGYLGYLAFDVFKETLSFPIVLATFGIAVIVITVWLQRRYPALARQVQERQAGARVVPHAVLVFGGAIVVALVLFAVQVPEARTRAEASWARTREAAMRVRQTRGPARTDSVRLRTAPAPVPPGS